MSKLADFWNLFRKGEAVADPDKWRAGQITGSAVAGVLAALVVIAKAYGIDVPLNDQQLLTIGGAVVAVVGMFVHPAIAVITSTTSGLPAKPALPTPDRTPAAGLQPVDQADMDHPEGYDRG